MYKSFSGSIFNGLASPGTAMLGGDRHAPVHNSRYNGPFWSSAVHRPIQSTSVHFCFHGIRLYQSTVQSVVHSNSQSTAVHSITLFTVNACPWFGSTPVKMDPLWSSPLCTPVHGPLWFHGLFQSLPVTT